MTRLSLWTRPDKADRETRPKTKALLYQMGRLPKSTAVLGRLRASISNPSTRKTKTDTTTRHLASRPTAPSAARTRAGPARPAAGAPAGAAAGAPPAAGAAAS